MKKKTKEESTAQALQKLGEVIFDLGKTKGKASGKAMESKLTRDLREVGMSTKDFI